MADPKQKRMPVEDRFADEMGVLVSFLDPHLKTRTDAKPVDRLSLWSWRRAIAFVLVTGLIGWSAVLGAIYLLSLFWN